MLKSCGWAFPGRQLLITEEWNNDSKIMQYIRKNLEFITET